MPGHKPADWTPMLWPEEPEWLRPEALRLLEGSPVNCIKLAKPDGAFAEAATRQGIDVVSQPAVTMISDPVWPGVQRRGGGAASDAGPTGPPWVDANGWAVALARARQPDKPVWVPAVPPEDRVLRPEHYALSVADAEAYGARWVVALDASVRKGLLSGDGQARESWQTIVKALQFFRSRRRTPGEALANLAVISDFSGENEFLGTEVLNLSARRMLPCRIVIPPALDMAEAKAALWISTKAPEGAAGKTLREFVTGGGTLIVPASAAHMTDGLKPAGKHDTGYRLYSQGKGHIAVAPEPWSDPYVVATDAHRLLGRRHDPFRLWNIGSSNAWCAQRGAQITAHVINFAARPQGHPMSLWIAKAAKTARFLDLFGRDEALAVTHKNGGIEVSLPPFACYAAVDFGEFA